MAKTVFFPLPELPPDFDLFLHVLNKNLLNMPADLHNKAIVINGESTLQHVERFSEFNKLSPRWHCLYPTMFEVLVSCVYLVIRVVVTAVTWGSCVSDPGQQ